jgi:hypothetical protein
MSNPRPIKLKIDVSKILKDHLYKGAKGTYLDCVVWPNKDGTGNYGDTHYIVQELSRQARDAGERGPIIGNATVPEVERPIQREERQVYKPAARKYDGPTRPIADDMGDDDIPF